MNMAEKVQSFIHQLKFDPKLEKSHIASYLFNPRLAILFVFLVVIVGIYSFIQLPRTLNPDIKIPIVIVSTVLPGAGPKDIERLVTIPIEDGVSNLTKVKQITSTSNDSVSVVTLEFESGVDPDKAKGDVQSAVDGVSDLPADAQTPNVIKLDFTNAPVWTFVLAGNNDLGSLERYAQILQKNIKDLPNIDKVTLSGFQEEEVQITISPQKAATYQINPFTLMGAIQTSLKSFPAGTVKTSGNTFAVSIDQTVTSLDDLRNLPITVNSTNVSLGAVTDIALKTKPDQNPSILTKEQKSSPAIVFNVYKTSSSNIDKAVADTKTLLSHEVPLKTNQFHIYTILDAAEQVSLQFSDLQRDFLITVVLVFIVLFLFLGIRQAIIASLAIPITFFISFSVMYFTGISLSFISLFSLLLALGLLVDDTIVVASAITSYYRTGNFTPAQAGLLVWRDFLVAIFTTTITTVWAFFPLLLSTGIIGDFIKPIPIVVSTTLLASFIVAMFITLPFVIIFLQGNLPKRVIILLKILGGGILAGIILSVLPKGSLYQFELVALVGFLFITWVIWDILRKQIGAFLKNHSTPSLRRTEHNMLTDGVIHFTFISNRYHSIIESILSSGKKRRLTIIMVIIFSLFSYTLLPLGFVKNEFFPKSDQDYVYVSLSLPSGTSRDKTLQESQKIVTSMQQLEGIHFITTEVGQSMSDNGGSSESSTNNVLFSLLLKDKKDRKSTSIELGEKLRTLFKTYTAGKIAVTESTGGPPAGADLQITLLGDDLTILSGYADKIETFLQKESGATDIDRSIKSGTSKITFKPNQTLLNQNSITLDQIGGTLRFFASGMKVNSYTFENTDGEKKDITLRAGSDIQTPEMLGTISISGKNGSLPLSSLGELKLENNPTSITRQDGKRSLTVTASVRKGYSTSTENSKLEKFADGLNLPSGYSWKTGGVNEENQNSVNSILAAMLLSFLLIIVTMVLQFSSFRRALIVMLVIPLSISGVFIVFALTGTPLSFPALIGVLALFGIVVKNAILIVDKIIQNEEMGIPFIPAIADACASRLEAIALTSVATIIGLVPITVSDPVWRGLGGAIIAGLTFSGTIMLFFIPVVYYYWFSHSVPVDTRTTRDKHEKENKSK
jgi:HAE1 family hydrophobic/amphiphilic exporter-1